MRQRDTVHWSKKENENSKAYMRKEVGIGEIMKTRESKGARVRK